MTIDHIPAFDGPRPPSEEDVDRTVAETMAEELCRMPAMTVEFQPLAALQIAGMLQLALRHPRVRKHQNVCLKAQQFLEAVRQYLADCPACLEVMRRADDPGEHGPLDSGPRERPAPN